LPDCRPLRALSYAGAQRLSRGHAYRPSPSPQPARTGPSAATRGFCVWTVVHAVHVIRLAEGETYKSPTRQGVSVRG